MGSNRGFVAPLGPGRHDVPHRRAEDALRGATVFGAPAQRDDVVAEMQAIEFNDAQPTFHRFCVHVFQFVRGAQKHLINVCRCVGMTYGEVMQ